MCCCCVKVCIFGGSKSAVFQGVQTRGEFSRSILIDYSIKKQLLKWLAHEEINFSKYLKNNNPSFSARVFTFASFVFNLQWTRNREHSSGIFITLILSAICGPSTNRPDRPLRAAWRCWHLSILKLARNFRPACEKQPAFCSARWPSHDGPL